MQIFQISIMKLINKRKTQRKKERERERERGEGKDKKSMQNIYLIIFVRNR